MKKKQFDTSSEAEIKTRVIQGDEDNAKHKHLLINVYLPRPKSRK